MSLARLPYCDSAQNARVSGDVVREQGTSDALINKAYRQVFFHAMEADRDPYLESQLRNGTITVRDFIRGLLLSERFLQGYHQCSSNDRMVDQVVGRILGRATYGEQERRSWAVTIAELGFVGFVDLILDSPESMNHFGYDCVPQQHSRVHPGRGVGEIPICQRFPRYGADWRDSMKSRASSPNRIELPVSSPLRTSTAWMNGQPRHGP